MKKTILLFFSIASIFSLFSQSLEIELPPDTLDKNSNNQLLIKFGLGIPLGVFAEKDLQSSESGFANPGILFEGEYRGFISKSVYLGTAVRVQFNDLEEDVLLESSQSQVPSDVSVTIEAEQWTNTSIMGGFGTVTLLDPKTVFFTRFMAGITFSTTPSFESVLTDGITTVVETQNESTANEFSYSVGLGLKIEISPSTMFVISGDYFGTQPAFEDIEFTAVRNGVLIFKDIFSFSQKMKLMNVSLGLAFNL